MTKATLRLLLLISAVLAVTGPAVRAQELFAPLSDQVSVDLPSLDASIPSPQEVLGYSLGTRFTHHERILAYLDALSAASDRVVTWEIGRTYEDRPLRLVAISSPSNIARLQEILALRERLAQPTSLTADERQQFEATPVVAWLGFGVHGNEPSSAEAAMAAAYVLAAADGEWTQRREEVVVLIDPLTNPDGRERYVHFFESHQGARPDPSPESAEHWERWPGGRQNHYLIDLNRDWAWATQIETQHRLQAFHRWQPQVYVDFHEMFNDSTYFFPPSAEPIHPEISSTTVEWLKAFGAANAEAFDQLGWVYYSAERFDLFYPGYGDSYPSLCGAVGMTYEVAGHGFAGAALERQDGSRLSLSDRVARHFTTALATVSTTASNRGALLADFVENREALMQARPRTYLWSTDDPEGRAALELLLTHSVDVRQLGADVSLAVRQLRNGGAMSTRDFGAGTLAVSTAQPLGAFLKALMETDAKMSEDFVREQRRRVELNRRTEFFDVTSWALPLAFNLDVAAYDGIIPNTVAVATTVGKLAGEGDLGYLIPPHGLAGYKLAALLQERSIQYRVAIVGLENGGITFPSGTIFVPRRGNTDDLEATMMELSIDTGLEIRRVASGYAEGGISLGSDLVVPIRPSTIGIVGGAGVSATSFGSIWHLFDRQVGLQVHRLDLQYLDRLALEPFDVLVLPNGREFDERISETTQETIDTWVKGGGVLIGVGRAVGWLQKHDLTSVENWKPEDKADGEKVTPAGREIDTPGATLATVLQPRHPLIAGVESAPPALFLGPRILLPTGDPRQDVLLVREDDPVVAGFAWPEAGDRLSGALLVGVERLGAGAVAVFSQDPEFRLFWRGTAPLFLNTAMFGPSLRERQDI